MNCYSTLLTKWPHYVLSTVVFLVIACGILAGLVIPLPDFSNPILGFEARGTRIKGQEQVLLKLQSPEENGITFVPPQPFKRELISNPYVLFTFVNYINSALNITLNVVQNVDDEETSQKTTNDSDCSSTLFNPKSPKIAFAHKDGQTLLTVPSIRAMCSIEKRLTESLQPPSCIHRISLTSHMELLSGKDCEDLEESDIQSLVDLLLKCMPYYENGMLSENCGHSVCSKVPIECQTNHTAFNVIHFITDSQFFSREVNKMKYNKKLTFALLSVANIDLSINGLKEYYRSNVEPAQLEEGKIFVKAVDSRVKFELFNDYLLENMVYFAVAMILILIVMFLYLRSFTVTIATVLNVVFTLVISYTFYYCVLGIRHFPFINVLTGLICIAISADDVFIFYDTWQQMKLQYPNENLTFWMSKTLSHAALSIFVTSLTTASAFLSNLVSEITDIRCFGVFSGVAIMCNFLLMITWVPSIVVILEKYGKSGNSTCCKCYETFNQYLTALNVIFEKFLPFIVVKSWFVWLFFLFVLGTGGAVVLFFEPRLELPTSREFQVYKSSDPMEVWDLEMKQNFRYIKYDVNDITTQGLPVSLVWGLTESDNGNQFNPNDTGTLVMDYDFNMTSIDSQRWLSQLCDNLTTIAFTDPLMKHVPCSLTIFNEMMALPCGDPRLSPCCGQSNHPPPFQADIFQQCFPKLISAFQFLVEEFGQGLPQMMVAIGSPVYLEDSKDNDIIGYIMNVKGNQPWSPILDEMRSFSNELDDFLEKSVSTAPSEVKHVFITSGFKFYDLQRALSSGTYVAIGVSVAVAFIVMLMTTLNFLITLYALFTIVLSISVTVGSLVLLGWKLNILESITISLAVGLSIDFTIHYGVAYRLSASEVRVEKVKESFQRVGSSVAMAAFTTFIAGAAMMPATVLAYTQLGVFLMLVMAISWTYSTLFFQSLCCIIGPKRTLLSFSRCAKRTTERVDDSSQLKDLELEGNAIEMKDKPIANGIHPLQGASYDPLGGDLDRTITINRELPNGQAKHEIMIQNEIDGHNGMNGYLQKEKECETVTGGNEAKSLIPETHGDETACTKYSPKTDSQLVDNDVTVDVNDQGDKLSSA